MISPEIQIHLRHLEEICTILRKNNITLSKTVSMKIVGSRGVLERLVATKKIRTKQDAKQDVKPKKPEKFSRWECFAEDVFRYANYKERLKA